MKDSGFSSFVIYWEASIRNEIIMEGIEYGLEEPIFLALFELTMFYMAHKDPRIFEDVYSGFGIMDDKYNDIYNKFSYSAIVASKGSEAVINLRLSSSEFARTLTHGVDIDGFLHNCFNEKYVDDYTDKLLKLYDNLLRYIQENRAYSLYVDVDYIRSMLKLVNVEEVQMITSKISERCKSYISSCRDSYNIDYVVNHPPVLADVSVICVGSAHIANLKYDLYNIGIESFVIGSTYSDIQDDDVLEMIKLDLKDIRIKS